MAISIRFSRLGKRHNPIYRIVVQDKESHPKKRFIENLGNYYPLGQQKPGEPALNCDMERVQYWVENGAKCSDRVWHLLKKNGLSLAGGAKQR